jgi:hypothetical protein
MLRASRPVYARDRDCSPVLEVPTTGEAATSPLEHKARQMV